MPTLGFRTADVSAETSKILRKLLKERGMTILKPEDRAEADGIVCYGWGGIAPKKNILNARAGELDNLAQIKLLSEYVRVPSFVTDVRRADFARLQFPMLAREARHSGGEGIMPVLQAEELAWRKAAGAQYFVSYIPSETEFRVWVYRRQILAVYEKVMETPSKYRGIGRNYKDGFTFEFRAKGSYPTEILEPAAVSVFAMGLDFGGVDILKGKDGRFYVLEVNSAPGTFYTTAVGINKLADRIVRWAENGFPAQSKEYKGIANVNEG